MVAIPLMKGVPERQEESQNPREPCQVSANSRGAGMHVAPHTVLWLWKHAGCMSVAELPLISVRIWKGGKLERRELSFLMMPGPRNSTMRGKKLGNSGKSAVALENPAVGEVEERGLATPMASCGQTTVPPVCHFPTRPSKICLK